MQSSHSSSNSFASAVKKTLDNNSAPQLPYHMNRGGTPYAKYTNVSSNVTNRNFSKIAATLKNRVKPKNVEEHLKKVKEDVIKMRLSTNLENPGITFNNKIRYFVIKSFNEDDIHRSIKYKIWCSSKINNDTLDESFQETSGYRGHTLLLFSVNGSSHFCGVAEMVSNVDKNFITNVWCEEKWTGYFFVKWLYVKDVPFVQLRHLSTAFTDSKMSREYVKPITNVRDATEIRPERPVGGTFKDDIGYQALNIIMQYKAPLSVFDDYVYYEKRELKTIR